MLASRAQLQPSPQTEIDPDLAASITYAIFATEGVPVTLRDFSGNVRNIGPHQNWPEDDLDSAVGNFTANGLRFFDEDGQSLSRLEHPAHVTRVTGEAQRSATLGVRGTNDSEWWLRFSFIPVARGPEGWSVLGVGADVSDLFIGRRVAQERAEALAALLDVTNAIIDVPPTPESIAEALEPLAERIFPGCNVAMALLEDNNVLRLTRVQRSETADEGPDEVPLRGPMLEQWTKELVVNQQVSDTDIYANQVVGSLELPFRSIAQVALRNHAGERFGTLACVSALADFFSEARIEALQRAATLIGPRLDLPGRRAAA